MKFLKVAALMLVMAVGSAQPFPSRDVLGFSWTKHNPKQIMRLAAVSAAIIAEKSYGFFSQFLPCIFKQNNQDLNSDEVDSPKGLGLYNQDLNSEKVDSPKGLRHLLNINPISVRTRLHLICKKGLRFFLHRNGRTPLHYACMHGDLVRINNLLKRSRTDVDQQDQLGYTPFQYACLNYLMGARENKFQGNISSKFPALSLKKLDLVRVLLEQKITYEELLIKAVEDGYTARISELFKLVRSAYLLKDSNGQSLLHIACNNLDLKMVEALLPLFPTDANINIRNNEGKTLLDILDEDSDDCCSLNDSYFASDFNEILNNAEEANREGIKSLINDRIKDYPVNESLSDDDDISAQIDHLIGENQQLPTKGELPNVNQKKRRKLNY
jgi:hypothetical protein